MSAWLAVSGPGWILSYADEIAKRDKERQEAKDYMSRLLETADFSKLEEDCERYSSSQKQGGDP